MIDHRRASLSKQHYTLPFHGTQQGLINSFNHSFYHDVTHVRKDTRLSPAFLSTSDGKLCWGQETKLGLLYVHSKWLQTSKQTLHMHVLHAVRLVWGQHDQLCNVNM